MDLADSGNLSGSPLPPIRDSHVADPSRQIVGDRTHADHPAREAQRWVHVEDVVES